MASTRIIREAVQTALEVYRQQLMQLDHQRKALADKIAALEKEAGKNGQLFMTLDDRLTPKPGKPLPYTEAEVHSLTEQIAHLDLSKKSAMEAARLIYGVAGRDLHGALAYRVAVNRGFTSKVKHRPADKFASYMRRSNEFEKLGGGKFRWKGKT